MERLEALEKALNQLIVELNTSFGKINERFQPLESTLGQVIQATQVLQLQFSQAVEILDATVQLLGSDAVEKTIQDNRRIAAVEKDNKRKAKLDADLEAKKLTSATNVTDTSTLVFTETLPDGKEAVPARAIFEFLELQPEFRKQVQDQAPGVKLTAPNGNTFELKEVYVPVAAPETSAPAEVK
jgi:hypothetical protein